MFSHRRSSPSNARTKMNRRQKRHKEFRRRLVVEHLESRWLLANLISYWTFDEGVGNVAGDWAGANHGTVHGATWTTGKVGGALSFDGGDDYVEVPDNANLRPEAFTIEAWVNIADYSTNPIVGNRDVDLQSYQTYNFVAFVMRGYE